MDEIYSELREKTDVKIYVALVETLENQKSIREYGEQISKDIESPFIILTFAKIQKKVDIVNSKELNSKFDRDEILNDFIIPIFTSKGGDKKFGAGIFNGYAEIADQIATSYNIELKSSIGSEGKNSYDIIMLFVWFMLLSFIGTFFYIYFKRN